MHYDGWHFYCQPTGGKALLLKAARDAPAPTLSEYNSLKLHPGYIHTLLFMLRDYHVSILRFKMDIVLICLRRTQNLPSHLYFFEN